MRKGLQLEGVAARPPERWSRSQSKLVFVKFERHQYKCLLLFYNCKFDKNSYNQLCNYCELYCNTEGQSLDVWDLFYIYIYIYALAVFYDLVL